MIDKAFWQGRRVFLTGHTGFKGSWLSLWLERLGAHVSGYALEPPTDPSLFALCALGARMASTIADLRDLETLSRSLAAARPEVVFHFAAQPIVTASYRDPVETYAVNLLGTVHLLEAVRRYPGVRAVVVVTTDKVYENRDWIWGYRENEALGGYDPYSASKACAEIATASWRDSFFNPARHAEHGVAVASVRAGNIIGGGDWAADRLLPDCVRALLAGEQPLIRNPHHVRPWQHVLDPLAGYLTLAQLLMQRGPEFSGGWNFGPDDGTTRNVESVVRRFCDLWGQGAGYRVQPGTHPHEARYLKLDCAKARELLGWRPLWGLDEALDRVVTWTRGWRDGVDPSTLCRTQIDDYLAAGDNAP